MAVEKLLLLSGAIGAGKTSVANALIAHSGFQKVSSSGYLRSFIPPGIQMGQDEERRFLQETGDRLDEETDYYWIVDPVTAGAIACDPSVGRWLIDAVRKSRQVEHFRQRFGAIIRHIHLTAPEHVLAARYAERGGNYGEAVAHPNEVNARSLESVADLTIDTASMDPSAVAARILTTWEA